MSGPVTVVVPAHGHPEWIRALLAALDEQASDVGQLPVIVSDDASPRPLAADVDAAAYPSLALEIVRSEANGGPGAARNRALARVGTPWVAFLDSDELPGAGWLERLAAIAEADALDGVEGRITTGAERATPFTHIAEATIPGAHHVAGNIAFRTEALRRLGGFDERYYDAGLRLHFREDTELFFRVEAAGLEVPYDGELLAHHPPLKASWSAPLRDARRYYFDALLAREHGARFRSFNRLRRVGPVPLRTARHRAAVVHVASVATAAVAVAAGRRRLAGAAGAIGLATWGANALALAWGRRVRPQDVAPLAVVALGLPWVYAFWYYRGAVRFRHLPRL